MIENQNTDEGATKMHDYAKQRAGPAADLNKVITVVRDEITTATTIAGLTDDMAAHRPD